MYQKKICETDDINQVLYKVNDNLTLDDDTYNNAAAYDRSSVFTFMVNQTSTSIYFGRSGRLEMFLTCFARIKPGEQSMTTTFQFF